MTNAIRSNTITFRCDGKTLKRLARLILKLRVRGRSDVLRLAVDELWEKKMRRPAK